MLTHLVLSENILGYRLARSCDHRLAEDGGMAEAVMLTSAWLGL